MKKFFMFLFMFLFIGLAYSGGERIPTIEDAVYEIQYQKGNTQFVYFVYDVYIQGTSRTHVGYLEIVIIDEYSDIIDIFKQEVKIRPNKVQTFSGSRLVPMEVVDDIHEITFDLIIYQKKY